MSEHSEVVFCTHDSPSSIGGPFTWLRRLLPALREKGVNSRVLALTHYGGTGTVVEGLRNDGFVVHTSDCHDRTEDQIRWIIEQIGSEIPSVFVANFVVSALFASRWLKEKGVCTVGILHSDDAYYRAIQDQFLFGSSEFRLRHAVCVSESLTHEVTQRGFPATYIPYGVEIPATQARFSPPNFRIAYVGRLAEEQKRISLIARAFIKASHQLPNIEAVIFGDGPDRNEVLRILAEEGTEAKVRWGGPLKHEDVQNTLLCFQALALLSDYEGLPISLLEAMACGCVGICRNMRSGIPQLIENNKTGILVTDEIQSFVDAVRDLSADAHRASRIGSAGREIVKTNYAEDVSVEKWYQFLKPNVQKIQKSNILLPRRLRLPKAHPMLESREARRPPISKLRQKLCRLRILFGAFRRRYFKNSIYEQKTP